MTRATKSQYPIPVVQDTETTRTLVAGVPRDERLRKMNRAAMRRWTKYIEWRDRDRAYTN